MTELFSAALRTERPEVALRLLRDSDAEALFSLIDQNRAHLSQYGEKVARDHPDLASVLDSIRFTKTGRARYGIRDAGRLVGSASIGNGDNGSAVIGYWVVPPFLRRGYARLAVEALVAEAFRLRYPEVCAVTHADNLPSQKVLLKAGFALDRESLYTSLRAMQLCFSRVRTN